MKTVAALPPPSGETQGMLAVADLPAIGKVDKAWVGTDPVAATTNPAATPCDKANFVKAGGRKAQTRTFLIPEAKLPKRFGLTETIATFSSPGGRAEVRRPVISRMKACPDRELGSTVTSTLVQNSGPKVTAYARWRLESQVNKKQFEINYWMGIARVGGSVAQVNLTPVETVRHQPRPVHRAADPRPRPAQRGRTDDPRDEAARLDAALSARPHPVPVPGPDRRDLPGRELPRRPAGRGGRTGSRTWWSASGARA